MFEFVEKIRFLLSPTNRSEYWKNLIISSHIKKHATNSGVIQQYKSD